MEPLIILIPTNPENITDSGTALTIWGNLASGSLGVLLTLFLTGLWRALDKRKEQTERDLRMALNLGNDIIQTRRESHILLIKADKSRSEKDLENLEEFWMRTEQILGHRRAEVSSQLRNKKWRHACTECIKEAETSLIQRSLGTNTFDIYRPWTTEGKPIFPEHSITNSKIYITECSKILRSLDREYYKLMDKLNIDPIYLPSAPREIVPDSPPPPLYKRLPIRIRQWKEIVISRLSSLRREDPSTHHKPTSNPGDNGEESAYSDTDTAPWE